MKKIKCTYDKKDYIIAAEIHFSLNKRAVRAIGAQLSKQGSPFTVEQVLRFKMRDFLNVNGYTY
jgi:hypothetical protein